MTIVIRICEALFLGMALPTMATEETNPLTLRVPAFTAYSEPRPEALDFSEQTGVSGWKDTQDRVVWYGTFSTAGKLNLSLSMRLPGTEKVTLRLTVAKQAHTAAITGANGQQLTVPFGTVSLPAPGTYRFELRGLSTSGAGFGDLDALLLEGPALRNAHFNLVERRNAASVHLGYPLPAGAGAVAFYNELTVRTTPLWSYYMACGFERGYFGIQVNSPTERRIIFSVWDSGNEAVDRSKVAAEDRVQLVGKGPNVVTDSFGNEGTGGHSHLVYNWKKDTTYRFLVTAKPDGTHTTYSGWFYFPEQKRWGLIASFRAPKDGKTLRGLYSFNENFGGANGQERRLAEFGNGWAHVEGKWTELVTARFTHDPTGRKDRLDYTAGTTPARRFFLSNGGFVFTPITHFGDKIQRSASGNPPRDLPPIPTP